MKLNFGRIEIHNFKSFLDEEFDFSSMSGMTLVCGKNLDIPGQANSAGKSSIFDALLYALFGQLQTKIKNSNLHNRYSDDPVLMVSLDFDIDKTKFYRITRGLNKYGQSYCYVYRLNEKEEKNLTKSSIAETQDFIEREILKCDVSIFLRTVLLSSDQNYNFFLLSPYMKKDFVEKLFNIRVFGEMYALIHKDILNFDKEIIAKQNQLLMLNKSDEDYKERIDNFNTLKENKISELEKEKEELTKQIDELSKKHVQVNEEEVKKLEDEINSLVEKRQKVNETIFELQKQDKDRSSKLYKLQAKKDSNKKTIDSYSNLLSKLCNECKPIVSDYYDLGKLEKQNTKIESEIEKLLTAQTESSNKLTKCNDACVKIDSITQERNSKIRSMSQEANNIKIELVKAETQLTSVEEDLDKTKNETNPYLELYESNHKKLLAESESLNGMNLNYKYLQFAEQIVSQYTLKKFIIKDLIGLLNSKIKFYLMKLGAKYTCIFDENMDYTFITPDNGGETEYATFSAGERMRLSIATSFAFRDFMSTRNNFMSNILILDEYIDSNLDDLAINGVLNLLREFSKLYEQNIMIVSHRKEIDNSIFDNIIMVEKKDNISKIKYLPPEK